MGQIEMEIYTTAISRPEEVTPRTSGTKRAKQNHSSGTVYWQKGRKVANMISVTNLIHTKV